MSLNLQNLIELIRIKDWIHYPIIVSIFFYLINNSINIFYIIGTFLFVMHMYMLNDYNDLNIDKHKKINRKLIIFRTKYKRPILNIIISSLLISLVFYSYVSLNILILVVIVFFLNFLYSSKYLYFKSIAGLDLILVFLITFFFFLTAFNQYTLQSILISSFFGLFVLISHPLQCMIDYKIEKRFGMKTIAVFLGLEKTLIYFRIMTLFLVTYLFVTLTYYLKFVFSSIAFIFLLPVLFSFINPNPNKIWNVTKIAALVLLIYLILNLRAVL